jgi:uncharacterized membrane protein YphA (DoxX/SURF4 family)
MNIKPLEILGRAALGAPFIKLGVEAAQNPGARVKAAEGIGLPAAETMVRFNGAAMAAGGAAIVLGKLQRTAAAGMVLSLIPTTYAGHQFWTVEDPAARKAQQINFLKNVALAGAFAVIAARD